MASIIEKIMAIFSCRVNKPKESGSEQEKPKAEENPEEQTSPGNLSQIK